MRKFITNSLNRLFGRGKPVTLESELAKRINKLVDEKPSHNEIASEKHTDMAPEPFVYEMQPTVYELPIVPVIKRKSKTRETAKTIRKSRKRIARKAKK